MKRTFLQTKGTGIFSGARPVMLRGVNLGGWLMMEGYMLHARNVAEQAFKKEFRSVHGPKGLAEFEKYFRDNFVTEKDFQRIAFSGFNCVRLPFNFRLIEKAPYRYDPVGVERLKTAVRWAKKNRLWVILDLHAAPGAQNHDWHSDSLGTAELWRKKSYQDRTAALWEYLAGCFKDEEAVAGYDVLNEAVLDDAKVLNSFYRKLIRAIRRSDPNHILFVEGNRWAMDLDCLDDFEDENLALSVHFYWPMEFTFNLVPGLSYPMKRFGKKEMKKALAVYARIARRRQRPIFVGEFGVNVRDGFYREHLWLKDILECFRDFQFHWTYWTYKTVKNSIFPDGIYSYRENPPWVSRQGPRLGWDNYAPLWEHNKHGIVRSWRTDMFQVNEHIGNELRQAAKTK